MGPIIHIFNSSIVSGPETLVLPALGSLGRPVVVLFLRETRRAREAEGPIAYARSLGLEVRCIDVRSRVDLKAVRALAGMLRELAPSVAHAHDVKASSYLALAAGAGNRRKFPIFSTHHGVRGRSGWKPRLYERFYSRLILRRFDRVLTVCTSDHGMLLRRGLPEERLRIHLNGVDRRLVAPENRPLESRSIRESWGLDRLGVPADSVLLGAVGRLAPEKRLDRLLRMAAALQASDPGASWSLVLFGTGPLEAELKALATRLGVERRTHWLGYRKGVGDELAGLDILVSLSDAEGLPINLVEAGWAGTPVLATAVDGNLDLIPSPEQGMLVPVSLSETGIASAARALIGDPARRDRVGRAFQRRVTAEFSGRRWIARLLELYDETPGSPSL